MKTDDKAAWRPRRFDVGGAHPDEVYRAVAEVASAVDEIAKQAIASQSSQRYAGMDRDVQTWRQNKPLRFGRNLDADVQQFLAQGVRIMDGFNDEMPLGLSDSHRQVRNRCNELARGMEKVLARRPDEERPGDSWKYVKIRVTPVAVKQPGLTAWSVEKTTEAVRNGLRGHFEGSPWKAAKAQQAYARWAKNAEAVAEKTVGYPPMPEGARSWHAFVSRVDALRESSARRGEHWAQVDLNEGIDFSQVINRRPSFGAQQKPRMRMP
jgi:hypothetical protein